MSHCVACIEVAFDSLCKKARKIYPHHQRLKCSPGYMLVCKRNTSFVCFANNKDPKAVFYESLWA